MANFAYHFFIMYCLKKTITAFALMLLLATPLFFSICVLVKQQIAHQQREKKFSKETLQTIHVYKAEIFWVKAGKEILYKGKLFDVKSFTTKGNSISLTGFFDHKEDKLVQQIVKLALQKNESGSQTSDSAIKFLFFPAYSSNLQEINYNAATWSFISQQYHQFDEMIPSAPCRLPVHPPC